MKFKLTAILVFSLNCFPLIASKLNENPPVQYCNCFIKVVNKHPTSSAKEPPRTIDVPENCSVEQAATECEKELKLIHQGDSQIANCLDTLGNNPELHKEATPFLRDNYALIISLVRQSLEQQLNPGKESANDYHCSIPVPHPNEGHSHQGLKHLSPKSNLEPCKRKNERTY